MAARRQFITLYEAGQLYGFKALPRPRYVPDGICEWCGKKIENKRRSSCCTKECTNNFLNATSPVRYANSGSRGGYPGHILRRDNFSCRICGEFHGWTNEHGIRTPTSDGQLAIHHIKSVHDGGSDAPDNLQTVCRDCHNIIHGYRYGYTAHGDTRNR